MNEPDGVVEFERLAEAAYEAMYDAKPHNVKYHRDDALLHLAHAIEAAKAAGLTDEVKRLERARLRSARSTIASSAALDGKTGRLPA